MSINEFFCNPSGGHCVNCSDPEHKAKFFLFFLEQLTALHHHYCVGLVGHPSNMGCRCGTKGPSPKGSAYHLSLTNQYRTKKTKKQKSSMQHSSLVWLPLESCFTLPMVDPSSPPVESKSESCKENKMMKMCKSSRLTRSLEMFLQSCIILVLCHISL